METKIRFSAVLGTFGAPGDRFVLSGYREPKSLEEMFRDAKQVEDLAAVELVGNWHINERNVDVVRQYQKDSGLEVSMIIPDIFAQAKWGKGSFTANDPQTRENAIAEIKKYMDIAPQLDCYLLDVWFGQDGYDYCFQTDYIRAWSLLIDGLKECADYRKDVKLGIEYKIKEPRTHCYVGTIGKTIALLDRVDAENVGVVLDIGHAFMAYENAAESIALTKLFGDKLFQIHFNDNYRLWDDDMIVSSVHILEYLELLYWLKKIDYKGWYSLDIYPYREDGIAAANESIRWLKSLIRVLDDAGDEIERIISSGDAVTALSFVRKLLFRQS